MKLMVVIVCALLFALPLAVFADDDVAALKAQNERLAETNLQLAKDNAALKAEVTALKDRLGKGVADTLAAKPPDVKPTDVKGGAVDSTMAVVKAIHTYQDALAALKIDNGTDIQKQTKWLAAAKNLDGVLSKNRATLTCTIKNVVFNSGAKGTERGAEIEVDTATIKSASPDVPDISFEQIYPITIATTATQAEKITKDSTMTLQTFLSLNIKDVDSNGEQSLRGEDEFTLVGRGYMRLGTIDGTMSPFEGHRNGRVVFAKPNAVLEIDGVKWKIESGQR